LLEDIHETGTTVIFATHDRTLLDVRPRRVVVLDEGKAMDVPNGLNLEQEGDELESDEPAQSGGDWGEANPTPTERLAVA